jgi:MYXO-CTERM domain-containing protein
VATIDNAATVDDFNRSSVGCGCAVAGGGSLVGIGVMLLVLSARRRVRAS